MHEAILTASILRDRHQALVGGKGWNLFRLAQIGACVPDFFVVSTHVFDAVLRSRRAALDVAVRGLHATDRVALERLAAETADWIAAQPLPGDTEAQIEQALRDLVVDNTGGGVEATLAVRSSVRGEDSSTHSFAGLMDSCLAVPRTGVIDAIRRVWRSAFSARALAYRLHHGLPVDDVSAAVIVQNMVAAHTSGILFSRHPETRDETCIIVAGRGLGDAVVTDRCETETYRVAHTGPLGSTQPQNGSSAATHQAMRPLLGASRLRALRDLALRLEGEFGAPQDIEWSFDGSETLHVLQTRPIVFASRRSSSADASDNRHTLAVRIWDNSNIIESYPGLTRALTFSVVREGYEHSFRHATAGFLALPGTPRPAPEVYANLIGLIHGRVYYNLLNWYTMLSFLPGFARHKKAWDAMIGIRHTIDVPVMRLSGWQRAAVVASIAWRLMSSEHTYRRFTRAFGALRRRFGSVDYSGADAHELLRAYENVTQELRSFWHLPLYNDFCAMTYYEALRRCTQRWIPGVPELHNDLLAGEGSVESVAPLRSLLRLVEHIRADVQLRHLFEISNDDYVWRVLQRDADFAEFRDHLDEHIEQYGDRTTEELKFETRTLHDEPQRLVPILRRQLAATLRVDDLERRPAERRRVAERTVRNTLRSPVRRLLFAFILRNARRAVAHRENMRLARTRLYGIVRHIFRVLGQRFVQLGILETADDLHDLTIEEITGILRGTAPTLDARAVVSQRRQEYGAHARSTLPERFVTHGPPHLAASRVPVAEPNGTSGSGDNGASGSRSKQRLLGTGCSSGRAHGRARVVLNPDEVDSVDGDILVARSTDPAWIFLMMQARGLVVEKGSVLSHTAIVGRELGIPTVVGVAGATEHIANGDRVRIDGSTGEVQWA